MSLFDSVIKTALEAASKKSPGNAGLANSILNFIQEQSGIDGIRKLFEEKGYGEAISSWISNADNLPISDQDILKILGKSNISA
jgi:uncharacterized protein YidB (DUF937 family)